MSERRGRAHPCPSETLHVASHMRTFPPRAMAVAPANVWGQNWSAGVSGASQKYTQGIQDTTIDVVGKAIAQQAALLSGFTAAVTSGEWARRLAAVGTAGWKAAALAKAANYITGATAGLPRYNSFASQAQPFWTNAVAAIDGMPSGGKANALARVGAWYDAMQSFKQSYTP